MRKFVLYLDRNSKSVTRILLFVFTTAILVWLFPREGMFPYEFQKGKPWLQADLYSTFDFPIRKTTNEIEAEKDSILKDFNPYYTFQNQVADEQIKKFNKSFNSVWLRFAERRVNQKLSDEEITFFQKSDSLTKFNYRRFFDDLILSVYSKGIIEVTEQLEQESKKGSTIILMRDNIGEDVELSDVFTAKTSYEYVVNQVDAYRIANHRDKIFFSSGFFKELNINEFFVPNLIYNDLASKNVKDELIKKISYTKGMFPSDRKVIGKGEIVNEAKFNLLESLKYEYENRVGKSDKLFYVILGQALVIGSLIILLMVFLLHFRRDVYHNSLRFNFVMLLIVIFTAASALAVKKEFFSLYIIPFAIVPIVVRAFFDARLAMYVHIITILIVSFLAPNSFEFLYLNFIAGTISIVSLTNLYRRSRLFTTAFFVFLSYCIGYMGLFFVQGNSFDSLPVDKFISFSANGLLILFAYPLIYLFEKMFGFLSDIKLMELADTNHPLLRKLNEKAPGTFQHVLQVANLAEEAAYLIGANPMLVRVGALYHDIGKMNNPIYFIENINIDKNPHAELSAEDSAKIIIDHVFKGIEIGRKAKLPEQIIDFIRTHHGNQTVQYFYRTFLKMNPEMEIDKSKFTYPGPIPFSKEMALVMMADSVEAASRSLKEFNHNSISDLVENIVYYQKINEQFNDSNITYKDMSIVKGVFKRKLLNMYHVRVEYPAAPV